MNKGIEFDAPLNEQISKINRGSNAPVAKCKTLKTIGWFFLIKFLSFSDNLLYQAEKMVKEGDLKSAILCATEALSVIAKVKYNYEPDRDAVTWNRSEWIHSCINLILFL